MQASPAAPPRLPFVLGDDASSTPDGASASATAVLERLDALHGLMTQTRADIEALRQISAHLVQLVEPQAGALLPTVSAPPPPSSAVVPIEVHVRLLGTFEVRVGSRAIERWRSRKARQLLALLALTPGRPLARDALIEVFWPEADPARGANNLSIAVHHVRSRLGEALEASDGNRGLIVEQGLYRLDPDLDWRIDAVEFGGLVLRAKAALGLDREVEARADLEAALRVYGGELLESDLTEEWVQEPRETLASQYGWAVGWMVACVAGDRDWERVLQLGQLLVQRDPCDEVGHRWLMRAHVALGNRAAALRQFRACEVRLREEFDVEPSEETRALLGEFGL